MQQTLGILSKLHLTMLSSVAKQKKIRFVACGFLLFYKYHLNYTALSTTTTQTTVRLKDLLNTIFFFFYQ